MAFALENEPYGWPSLKRNLLGLMIMITEHMASLETGVFIPTECFFAVAIDWRKFREPKLVLLCHPRFGIYREYKINVYILTFISN